MGAPVAPGELVAEKFIVERVLGEGGMGIVVAARHIQLGYTVAIKFLSQDALGSAEAVLRFEREARAVVRIQSEHVAKVLDVGKLQNGAPFIVMELLQGEDLSQRIAREGPLPIDVAVVHVLEACEALAEAHSLGIVHRDMKPANLFVANRTKGPKVTKVLDFGISKANSFEDVTAAGLTRTSTIMGSPSYMSPEQLRATRNVDARSDVWSLGATLFELVCGRPPFEAESLADLVAAVLGAPTPSMGDFRVGIPRELDTIVRKCLEKDPNKRFSSVEELSAALRPLADPNYQTSETVRPSALGPIDARGGIIVSTETKQTLAATMSTDATLTRDALPEGASAQWARRKRLFLGAAVIGVALGSVALALVLPVRRGHITDTTAVEAPPAAVSVSTAPANTAPAPDAVPDTPPAAVSATPNPPPNVEAHPATAAVTPPTVKPTRPTQKPRIRPGSAASVTAPSAPAPPTRNPLDMRPL